MMHLSFCCGIVFQDHPSSGIRRHVVYIKFVIVGGNLVSVTALFSNTLFCKMVLTKGSHCLVLCILNLH